MKNGLTEMKQMKNNLVMGEPTNPQTIPEIVNHMKRSRFILTYGA